MNRYFNIFIQGYQNYANYLWNEIFHPGFQNYFYALIVISLFVYLMEILRPWRKNQPIIRKDFWLDGFYMFFNFFLFSLLIYNAASEVSETIFNDLLQTGGLTSINIIPLSGISRWSQLLLMLVLRDFIHWNIHRLLHKSNRLWQFHKVHHSVEQMGFAAHLRYHWVENVLYRGLEYIPLHLLGFSISDFFLVHIFALTIGHLNHANLVLPLGPFKYLLNNPQMHIWHHARHLPADRQYGVNFGLTLSIWDYLFGTSYIPESGRDISLGFNNLEKFPSTFIEQNIYGFGKQRSSDQFFN